MRKEFDVISCSSNRFSNRSILNFDEKVGNLLCQTFTKYKEAAKMKVLSILFLIILLVPVMQVNAQKKGKTKEIGKELLGTYAGHQPKYAMQNKNGEDALIGGKKVWVPACEYKFELKAKNKVSMSQLSEEKSKPFVYTGTYSIVNDDGENLEILCKVSLDKYTNPEYTVVINKNNKTATCYGANEPAFSMTKTK